MNLIRYRDRRLGPDVIAGRQNCGGQEKNPLRHSQIFPCFIPQSNPKLISNTYPGVWAPGPAAHRERSCNATKKVRLDRVF